MNNNFLKLSDEDRRLAYRDAALKLKTEAVILEKDFWVSWLLGLLFTLPKLAPHLVFKGGTSLSIASARTETSDFIVPDHYFDMAKLLMHPHAASQRLQT